MNSKRWSDYSTCWHTVTPLFLCTFAVWSINTMLLLHFARLFVCLIVSWLHKPADFTSWLAVLLLHFYFSPPLPPHPLLLHRLLHSLHPYSAQVDRCLAGRPVIITVVLGVSSGWCWLFFEHFTVRTGQDRTFPVAVGERRRNEDPSGEDGGNEEF